MLRRASIIRDAAVEYGLEDRTRDQEDTRDLAACWRLRPLVLWSMSLLPSMNGASDVLTVLGIMVAMGSSLREYWRRTIYQDIICSSAA